MSDIVKFPYSASRRVAARRPRRSKNGTPEERAAKNQPATVSNVVSLLARRTEANTPMTKEEFAAAYTAATPAQQTLVLTMMQRLVEEQNRPNPPAASHSRRGAGCDARPALPHSLS
jgi:cell division protein FtsN